MKKCIERVSVAETAGTWSEPAASQTADYIADMCASLRAMATQPELHEIRIFLQRAEDEARRFAA